MEIEIGILIAVIGCLVGLAGWLGGRDKNVKDAAEWRGKVDAQLNTIVATVARLSTLEGSIANNTQRMRDMDRRIGDMERRCKRSCRHGGGSGTN